MTPELVVPQDLVVCRVLLGALGIGAEQVLRERRANVVRWALQDLGCR